MAEKIYVVSVGPGNPDYLLPRAQELVQGTLFLAGGERNLKLFNTENKTLFVIRNNLDQLKDFLLQNINCSPVVLASGDAGFFGVLKYLKKHIPKEKLVVIPGISSIQFAFARLADSWDDAVLLSAHGRKLADVISFAKNGKVAILTDRQNTPQELAKCFVENKLAPKEMVVLDNLSYPDEIIWRGTAEKLMDLDRNFLNAVVVIYNE